MCVLQYLVLIWLDACEKVTSNFGLVSGSSRVPIFHPPLITGLTLSHNHTLGARDLARTRPTCLLERQFQKNLLFGQAKIYMKIFQF